VSAWREHHGSAKGVGISLQPTAASGNRRALGAWKTFDDEPKSLTAHMSIDGSDEFVHFDRYL